MPEPRSPFAESAPYYKFRAPYALSAFAHIQSTFGLDSGSRVLDLGCGPGTVTIPLARIVGSVVAIDPCIEMIDEGREQAATAGCRNIRWHRMAAEDLTKDFGRFELVTLGQSFHWMSRDRVLQRLAEIIAPGGGLALINPGKHRPQESWEALVSELVIRYLGVPQRHPDKSPELEHEPSLLRSAVFSKFTSQAFGMEFVRDIASIVGFVYSMSTAPKSAFGARAAAFERELTEALLAMSPTGIFRERVETEVLIARN